MVRFEEVDKWRRCRWREISVASSLTAPDTTFRFIGHMWEDEI